jgi:hypothetical protein
VNISSCSFFSTPSLAAFSISCGGVKKKKRGRRAVRMFFVYFVSWFFFGLVLCVLVGSLEENRYFFFLI